MTALPHPVRVLTRALWRLMQALFDDNYYEDETYDGAKPQFDDVDFGNYGQI